jgi:hypothetical protein
MRVLVGTIMNNMGVVENTLLHLLETCLKGKWSNICSQKLQGAGKE